MNEGKSTLSQATSYQEMGEFWDTHDLDEFWEQTEEVEFTVNIDSQTTYYPLDQRLSVQLRAMAGKRGVSAETLLNLWIQEKVAQEVQA